MNLLLLIIIPSFIYGPILSAIGHTIFTPTFWGFALVYAILVDYPNQFLREG